MTLSLKLLFFVLKINGHVKKLFIRLYLFNIYGKTFYTKNLTKHAIIKIDFCLILIGFWMSSDLLNFQDKYYKCG